MYKWFPDHHGGFYLANDADKVINQQALEIERLKGLLYGRGRDLAVYGTSFIRVTGDGKMTRIPPEDVILDVPIEEE